MAQSISPKSWPAEMLAARVHAFGPPTVIQVEVVPTPEPGPGEVLIRVDVAGVGPWDALIRTGRSGIPQTLPLTLGSDICGKIVGLGERVDRFILGEAVYGVTNPSFVGGYAQYAVAKASTIAAKPPELSDLEAASAPVIGVTALQMLWSRAKLQADQSVLVHGATGNVGAYAVRMAAAKGLRVLATARPKDQAMLQALPLSGAVDLGAAPESTTVDAALDLVGGPSQSRLFSFVRPGGVLVSSVSPPDADAAQAHDIRAEFFIVDVDTRSLDALTALFRAGVVRATIGAVLPLAAARQAHVLMAATSRPPGKILLQVAELVADDQAAAGSLSTSAT